MLLKLYISYCCVCWWLFALWDSQSQFAINSKADPVCINSFKQRPGDKSQPVQSQVPGMVRASLRRRTPSSSESVRYRENMLALRLEYCFTSSFDGGGVRGLSCCSVVVVVVEFVSAFAFAVAFVSSDAPPPSSLLLSVSN